MYQIAVTVNIDGKEKLYLPFEGTIFESLDIALINLKSALTTDSLIIPNQISKLKGVVDEEEYLNTITNPNEMKSYKTGTGANFRKLEFSITMETMCTRVSEVWVIQEMEIIK